METDTDSFTKQCIHKQKIENDNEDIIVISDNSEDVGEKQENEKIQSITPTTTFIDVCNYDEPIDLTSTQKPHMAIQRYSRPTSENCTVVAFPSSQRPVPQNLYLQSNVGVRYNSVMAMQYIPRARGKRRRIEYSHHEGKIMEESKHVEVLKAAKSLFSKRTRTLYHWMYPNAPKTQIKAAVASSWESLGNQEKEFYISQVLGRFGFPQCSLMINPQLGGIKELPPLVETEPKPTTNELQNAISSILPESLYDITNERHRLLRKKRRQGRPPGSRNRKFTKYGTTNCDLSQDFQDDPELSKELEQFAQTLNMNMHIK